jgi:thioredoxin-dependent peroxiredoxin
MPVELRKRKDPPAQPPPPARKKTATGKLAQAKAAVKNAVTGASSKKEKAAPAGAPTVGSTITLEGFGGDIETHDGEKTSLAKLVEDSKAGVVLFTYPKASTPGCKFTALL